MTIHDLIATAQIDKPQRRAPVHLETGKAEKTGAILSLRATVIGVKTDK